MKEIIRQILREERSSTQKIKDLISKHGLIRAINAVGGFKNLKKTLGNDIDDVLSGIEPPYFQTLRSYFLDDNLELFTEIFSYIFSEPVRVSPFGQTIANENGNILYYETHFGDWFLNKYNDFGSQVFSVDSKGFKERNEYDDDGNMIYYENSDGFWKRYEYYKDGMPKTYKDSNGDWRKWERDEFGKIKPQWLNNMG